MVKCETTMNKKAMANIYKYYSKNHLRIPIARTVVTVFGLLLFIFCLVSLFEISSYHEGWDPFDIFTSFVMLFGLFFIWYDLWGAKQIGIHMLCKQVFPKKKKSVVFHYTFNDKGLYVKKPGSSYFYQWPIIEKFWEQKDCYVFEIRSDRYGLIDKNSFKNDDHAEFQKLLQEVLQPNQWGKHNLLIS